MASSARESEALKGIFEKEILNAAKIAEEQVDVEIKKYENVDEDDLEILRKQRISQLRKAQQQKQSWLSAGHGEYSEVPEEREFFETWKKSDRVVCHFYRDSAFRCKIVDKHLTVLAKKHLETRFVTLNAEKCPFLAKKLNIRLIPTVVAIKDGETVDYIRGFDDLGGTDDFPTEMLEWRLARSGVISYSGDKTKPPGTEKAEPKPFFGVLKKTSKNRHNLRDADDSSDSENDW